MNEDGLHGHGAVRKVLHAVVLEDAVGRHSEPLPGVPPPRSGRRGRRVYLFRWLYTRTAVSCSLRVSCRCTRQVKRSWCSARPSSLRACSEDTSRKFCGARAGQGRRGRTPPPPVMAGTHTVLHDQGAMQEPGLLGVREQPCGAGAAVRAVSGATCPAAAPPPLNGPCRSPCAISRFSSPSEIPTGMLGLVGSVTVSPLAGM